MTPLGNTALSRRWLAGSLIGLVLSLVSTARAATLIVQPDTSVENIVLEEVVINEDTSAGSGVLGVANIRRGGVGDNRVQLDASAQTCGLINRVAGDCSKLGRTTAFARAELFFEFCIPEAGAANCDSVPSVAEDITTTVSLDVSRIGQFITSGTGAAELHITARVRDLERSRNAGFQQIENISLGGGVGNIKFVKFVPIPVPEFDDEEIADKTVFTVQIRRGNVHRFSVFVAARADSGARGTALTIFNDILEPVLAGRVEVLNLSMDVSPEEIDPTTDQNVRIAALELRLADLGQQLNLLTEIQSELLGGLRQDLSDLSTKLDEEGIATGEIRQQLDVLTSDFNAHSHDCVLQKLRRAKRSHKGDDDYDDDEHHKGRDHDRPKWVIVCGLPTR